MKSLLVSVLLQVIALLPFSSSFIVSYTYKQLWRNRLFTSTSSRTFTNNKQSLTTVSNGNCFSPELQPYIAIVTDISSCDTDSDLEFALDALYKSVATKLVTLVSIRVSKPNNYDPQKQQRVVRMIQMLLEWSKHFNNTFLVIVTSDWIETAIQTGVHGIHFKENHQHLIPTVRRIMMQQHMIVGTSTHSTPSAINAWDKYGPIDYFFAGTCFLTQSHPEKSHPSDLEGPGFPGMVKLALCEYILSRKIGSVLPADSDPVVAIPPVFAIGGIDEFNCHETMCSFQSNKLPYGVRADGIATIRAVLKSSDPEMTVHRIKDNLKRAVTLP